MATSGSFQRVASPEKQILAFPGDEPDPFYSATPEEKAVGGVHVADATARAGEIRNRTGALSGISISAI